MDQNKGFLPVLYSKVFAHFTSYQNSKHASSDSQSLNSCLWLIKSITDLVESLLHKADAALVHWLAVGEEALLQRRGHGGEALQQREQVLVIVLGMKQK